MSEIKLLGKLIIDGSIELKTGLRIAGPTSGLKIGGVDQPVISDAFGKPYIPGSSLKGKLRSLIEKKENVKLNLYLPKFLHLQKNPLIEKKENVKLNKKDKKDNPNFHLCDNEEDFKKCAVCKIWGTLSSEGIKNIPTITRLIVRDTPLDEKSITEEMKKNMELAYTEIKMETSIDRFKGTALGGSLRTIDRVPAGAIFSPMEIVYNVFEESDIDLFKKVFEAMKLLEDDYLGGMGTRGYGKVRFNSIKIYWNTPKDYEEGKLRHSTIYEDESIGKILENFEKIKEKIKVN